MAGKIQKLVDICKVYRLTPAQTLDIVKIVYPTGRTTKASISSMRSRRVVRTKEGEAAVVSYVQ